MQDDWQRVTDKQAYTKRLTNPPAEIEAVFERLKRIIRIPSTPGYEQGIARELVEIFKPLCDEVHVDYMGNVYGKRKGIGEGPIIFCPAHIDSPGFIVTHIEPDGYIRFTPQGVIPPYLAYGQRMLIITPKGSLTGINGTLAGHTREKYGPDELVKTPMIEEQFIDVGAKSREEAVSLGIRPGQQVVYDRDLQWLGDGSSGMVTCSGLDDKLGCQVLIEALRMLESKKIFPTVYMVGTVQEEIGCRGASIASNRLDADMCVGVDGTISEAGPQKNHGLGVGRSPNLTLSEANASVGNGVYISVNDIYVPVGGLVGNQRIVEKLIAVARNRRIKYSIEGSMPNIISDAATAQFCGIGGTPAVTLKFPVRYTHGAGEVCSLFDIVDAAKLLAGFIEEMDTTFDLSFLDIPEADKGPKKRRKSL